MENKIICSTCAQHFKMKLTETQYSYIFGQCDECRMYSLCIDIPESLFKFYTEKNGTG